MLLLAREFGYRDLSWIGVLSAIGDMQNTKTGHFEGLNRIIQKMQSMKDTFN